GGRGVPLLAVGELSGQRPAVERALPTGQLLRLAGGLADAGGFDALHRQALRFGRMLLEVDAELVVDQRLDDALHLAVAELRLRLPLELRLGDLDADDGAHPLADVLALQRLVLVLEEVVAHGIGVHRARERRPEANDVCPAFDGVDVVREGVDGLVVARGPLHRDLDFDNIAHDLNVDHTLVDRRLLAVQVLDEALYASFVEELVRLLIALVEDRDVDAAVQ